MINSLLLQLTDGVITRNEETLIVQVNISLEAGEVALLTGPNGSGKSTLLTALAGEKFLSSGSLLFGETKRSQISLKEMSKKRSLMLQQDEAIDQLRASDVLELADIGATIPAHAKEFISKISINELRDKTLGSLSIGQRTRVFLAAIGIQNSEVILLDEPTAGLDWEAISLLSHFLVEHTKAGGAVLIATHENSLRSIAVKEFAISEKRLKVNKLS
jgi:ABC-type multidrug transport system ATPase subunit